jgi:hypothetical protein
VSDLESSTTWSGAAVRSGRALGGLTYAQLHGLVPVAIVALWLIAVQQVDPSRMTAVGLVSALPISVFLLLGLLLVSFAISLRREPLGTLVPLLHVLALVVMLYAVTGIVEAEPRFAVTYRHAGIVNYIATHRSVNPHLDAYFNWPGFFVLGGLFTKVLGVTNVLAYAAWAPLVFNLLAIPPLIVIFRWVTNDPRLLWLATWTFFSANWVGQDYLSPQAVAFVLWLVMLAILFIGFGRQPVLAVGAAARERAGSLAQLLRREASQRDVNGPVSTLLLLTVIGIFAAMTTGHQLTPFPALLTVVALTAVARLRRTTLPVTMVLLLAGWIGYMTIVYLAGHFHQVFGSISLSANLNQSVASRVKGSAGHLLVVRARILLTAALWLAAALGVMRRVRRGKLDLALLVVALVPFILPMLQPYGGEILIRVFLFALPAVAFFAAAAIYPSRALGRRPATTAMVVALGSLLLAGFQYARYGNEHVDAFTRTDVHTVAALYRIAPPGATLAAVVDNLPWKYKDYATYHYRSLAAMPIWQQNFNPDPASAIAQFEYQEFTTPTYVIDTPSMSIASETYDGKDAAIGRTVRLLSRSGLAHVVYQRDGGTILRLRRDPYPDDPMRNVHLKTFPGRRLHGGVTLIPVRFTGARDRLNATLFVPPGKRRGPGVLFLGGYGQSRPLSFTAAAELARRGTVTLVMMQRRGESLAQKVVDARRALDLLAQRRDVGVHRLGVVGYADGGQTAAVLSGVDLRLKTVGLIDPRSAPAALYWIRHTQAHLFFQAGLSNGTVRPPAVEHLIRAAPGRVHVRWYLDSPGSMRHIYADQVAWQTKMLDAH